MCFLKITRVLQYYTQFVSQNSIVTESGGWLLTTQKAIKRQAWWKRKFALFWRPAISGEGRLVSKAVPVPDNHWARAFIDWGRGPHTETTQPVLTVILKLVIGGLTSIILIVLGPVHLQFQGPFVSISWGQFSELRKFMSWLQSGHHVVNFSTWWGFKYL